MSKLIESNIPEGTLWPDLDDSGRVRLEMLIEAHGVSAMRRTCAALDEVDLSEAAQRRSYNEVRKYLDMFSAQSAVTPGQWASAQQDPFATIWKARTD